VKTSTQKEAPEGAPPKTRRLSQLLDLAWAAGFFDGEGCATIARVKPGGRNVNGCYAMRLQVSQVNPDPLVRMRELFGGSIGAKPPNNPRQSPGHVWWLCGPAAADALRCMLPFLRLKGRVAALCIKFQSTKRPRGGGARRAQCEVEADARYYSLVAELNARGPTNGKPHG